jgi:hypothetical protein
MFNSPWRFISLKVSPRALDNSTAAIEAPCELSADRALLEPEQPIASDRIARKERNSSTVLVYRLESLAGNTSLVGLRCMFNIAWGAVGLKIVCVG